MKLALSGKAVGYEGHKDKSSQIYLVPSGGVIRKRKERRSPEKTLYELVSLHIWKSVLDQYNSETRESNLNLNSPSPYGIDQDGAILMDFIPGPDAHSALSGDFLRGVDAFTPHEVRRDFARRFGRLIRIKEIEGLLHGDFQLRHLIQNVDKPGGLGVIDVENSCIVSSGDVALEYEKIQGQVDEMYPGSKRVKRSMASAFSEGYDSITEPYPIARDIVSDLSSSSSLGLEPVVVRSFVSN